MKNKKLKSTLQATSHKLQAKIAESLIETIVAVTIIAIGATGAGVIVKTSLSGVELSQDRMLALNLAREGIEGVRNIRDTNWLRYSANKDECWNSNHDASDITDCDLNLIADEYHSLKLDMGTLEYYLEDVGKADVSFDEYQLFTCEIENLDLGITGLVYSNPSNLAECTNSTETEFYRMIDIDYDATDPDNIMIVTSKVSWGDLDEGNTVTLTEYIGNW